MYVDGRQRVIIQDVEPEIDAGMFPVKRVLGERVVVEANVFSDGHDQVVANLLYRTVDENEFTSLRMQPLANDRWRASFPVTEPLDYVYTIEGRVDRFGSWRADLRKKVAAGQDVLVDLQIGQQLVLRAQKWATGEDAKRLKLLADGLGRATDIDDAVTVALSDDVAQLMERYAEQQFTTRYERELRVETERRRARFSTWYEFFPRSFGERPGEHGTLRQAEAMLPRIAKMGFDVVYLAPIHPIGETNRKGKNNSPKAAPGDPGSPWAIGSSDGGHKAVHPDLGTMEDFAHFVQAAKKHGMEVALDIAFQCSPDHPYITEHPEWFLWRPDGSIQFAENPPKKYEDIVPLYFETDVWKELWEELKSVFFFWAEHGVRIFRIDNPHTKPFSFWQWVIDEVKNEFADAIFLSEAFTRPQVKGRLAKIGFSQSYTYFTWRNSKWELIQYLTDLTRSQVREYLRPNFWPNTPDILPEFLQYGGRPAFLIRLCLAATLSSNYGIYGPAFELCVDEAIEGREEYLNSEKYEIKQWDLNQRGNLTELVAMINQIRHENEALQQTNNLEFLDIDNDYLLPFAKYTDDLKNVVFVVVNLDPFHKQSGWLQLPLERLGIDPRQPFLMHDLIADDKFIWQQERNYIELNPQVLPFHIFRLRRRLRREYDFDYYL